MPDIDPTREGEREDQERLTTADLAESASAGPGPQPETRSFAETGAVHDDGKTAPLLAAGEADGLRDRWSSIQAGFVDEPRRAVEQADGLVAEAMKRLAEMFAQERSNLEQQWDRGGDVSTEDLRQALQRYRSFFTRLLAI